MPTYVYKCENEHITERITSVANHTRTIMCQECDQEAKQILTPPRQVSIDMMPAYECPVTGEHVTSRHQRNEIMKRNNLVEMG